jgi:hypothetical protein
MSESSRERDAMQKQYYNIRTSTSILLKQIITKDRSSKQIEGGTNCVQSKWLALCKKPARRRPFEDDFRAARQGLCDAPPPRVTLSWPATCWILLLRCESPSFERPSCCKVQDILYRLPFHFMEHKNVLNVLSIENATTPINDIQYH